MQSDNRSSGAPRRGEFSRVFVVGAVLVAAAVPFFGPFLLGTLGTELRLWRRADDLIAFALILGAMHAILAVTWWHH